MKRETLVYVAGCSGSFPAPSERRPIWDPAAPRSVRWADFDRKEYGGRTTCFLIRHRDTFILTDHGLGVDPASELILDMLQQEGRTEVLVYVFQTHFHMDHIQGTPQNQLLYRKGTLLRYYSPDLSAYRPKAGVSPDQPFMEHVLGAYFGPSKAYFPLSLNDLPSRTEHVLFRPGETLAADEMTVRTTLLRHPAGCCAYRFEIPDVGAVVIATDNEPEPEPDPAVVAFFDGAEIVFADMQYSDEEYAGEAPIGKMQQPRKGWGHGTPRRLFPTLLACPYPPKKVRIVHHDPRKSDTDLKLFEERSVDVLRELAGGNPPFDYAFAKGGDVYWL